MSKSDFEQQLKHQLNLQELSIEDYDHRVLEELIGIVKGLVSIEDGIAVVSDYYLDRSYVLIGEFGKMLGLEAGFSEIDSALEDFIFNKVHQDDLIDRHALEVSFLKYLKQFSPAERAYLSTSCRIRMIDANNKQVFVNHRTTYAKNPEGKVCFALCTYNPSADTSPFTGIDGKIVNKVTGEIIKTKSVHRRSNAPLSKREVEVLHLLAQGKDSAKIAEILHIAVFTVRRHRQNILERMNSSNTLQAVRKAVSLGIISG